MKPGWKTSEFWLTLAVNLVAGLQASGLLADGGMAARVVAFTAMALSTAGYTYGRAYVKAKVPTLPAPKVEP